MTDLLVVESGAKARTLQGYLKGRAVVAACRGHVQDLPTSGKDAHKPEWASARGALPAPPWDYTQGARRVVGSLRSLAEKHSVDRILVATDPDREGEFIAWRLASLLGDLGPVRRVRFQEITREAVDEAVSGPVDIDDRLVEAALVRRLLDRLVGYRTSRFARSWRLESMGRVQTPTLGFVVAREAEIDAFVPVSYYEVRAKAGGLDWSVRFHEPDDPAVWRDGAGKARTDRTADAAAAKAAHDGLVEAGEIEIRSFAVKDSSRRPPLPFTTDTLLAAAGSGFKWRPGRTMRVAQSLYEAGHVTYMRTDSTRTNASSRKAVRRAVAARWGEDHLGPERATAKAGKGVQDAHEAIRPTRPDAPVSGLEGDEKRLYELVWARFAASQMAPSKWRRAAAVGAAASVARPLDGEASWRTFDGWEAAMGGARRARTEAPDAAEGERAAVERGDDSPRLVEDETKPPPRFTAHGLVAKMKAEGIGRPSTYAATIQKLQDREYVVEERGSLRPTDSGRTLWEVVVPHYGEADGLFSVGYTALMENALDAIEEGREKAPAVWGDFSTRFRDLHHAALEQKRQRPTPRQRAFFDRLASQAGEEAVAKALGGRDPEALDGALIREAIEALKDVVGDSPQPATEKQLAFIARLAERADLGEKEAAALVGESSYSDLTGGREGSASRLIEALREREGPPPASPKQIAFIRRLAHKAGLDEAAAAARVGAETYGDLTGGRGGTASRLITALRKGSKRTAKA